MPIEQIDNSKNIIRMCLKKKFAFIKNKKKEQYPY